MPVLLRRRVIRTGGTIFSASINDSPQSGSEAELRHRLLEYQAILDNASLGITFTCNRTFLHCNKRFSEMFGWTSNELVGKPIHILFPSPEVFAELIEKAAPVLGNGQRFDIELLMKRRDGSTFWCRMLGRAIDPNDHNKGTIFITEDITERKQAQEASQRLLLEYQAILDNASVGITFTRKRIFLHCSARFSEMFGWANNELVGQSISVIYPSTETYEKLTSAARPMLRTGQRLDPAGALVEVLEHDGRLGHDLAARRVLEHGELPDRPEPQESRALGRIAEVDQVGLERLAQLVEPDERLHAERREGVVVQTKGHAQDSLRAEGRDQR